MSHSIYANLENILSKIDKSHLSRDYQKNPIKTSKISKLTEHINKLDLEYMYLELNLSIEEISLYLNLSLSKIRRELKYNNISKPKKLISLKRKATYNDFYGVDNPSQLEIVKKKKQQTLLEHYGVDCPFKSEIIQRRIKENNIEKYGCENVFSNIEIQKKIYKTIKNNRKFNKSKEEDIIYKLLIKKFKNVERQYSSEKYPFQCDFYIIELDLYIEYQGFWTHGDKYYKAHEPYDKNNKRHRYILKIWNKKAKEINAIGENKNQYLEAIKTWSIKDPLKRETAKKNNLNWLEFFNMNQFMDWYNKL